MGEENNEAPIALGLDAYDTTAGAEEGAIMEVISPNGDVLRWPDGRPWTITYYGADSPRLENIALSHADRANAHVARTRSFQPAKVDQKYKLDYLVAATKSWDIPLANGEPAKNDQKEYRDAYLKYKWLARQGHVFVDTTGNFLKNGRGAS